MKNIVVIGCGSGIGLATLKALHNTDHIIGISKTYSTEFDSLDIPFYKKNIITDQLDDIVFPEIIDGIVYAPGSINLKPFHRFTEEDFRADFEINVLGAVKIIQQLLPRLKKSNSASIVLFSSVAAKIGMPFHASIATSKSAIEGLVRSLAAEFAQHNIRINAIAPSLTTTKLSASLLSTPEKIEAAAKRHPLQNIGDPNDIAKMIVFLLSDFSSWITGQIISIDGGMSNIKL
ncbi:SDR family oxidoreductase [Flavobacterium columnare]|nr:SDR family oxidoreductase [Flavobacterium columnare]AMO20000.2 SDR family oxidoreductase [Flavobacterium columnare]MBF6653223.1 oxidoreductase [Flavobacterium columnare]MBF6656366.1 oxidoreductase [Flavobacterium columnare]MBF6659098.1 oxidoreductase [Flavobacterium columnare]MEB3800876.1 SDR family oxidoreductase [Flavobacterium columnare]